MDNRGMGREGGKDMINNDKNNEEIRHGQGGFEWKEPRFSYDMP